jgi:hypothetical protein
VDRYPPSVFASQATAPDGTQNTLQESIDSSQVQTDSFLDTQGRGYNLAAGDMSAAISLYVDSSWATASQPAAGFWTVGTDGSNNVQDYPIIEYFGANSSVADPGYNSPLLPPLNAAGFYGYNDEVGSWQFITAGNVGWNSLGISLAGPGVEYTVDGTSIADVGSGESVELSEVILEGYNDGTAASGLGSYNIYWNDLSASSTPEPGTTGTMLMGVGMLLLGARSRRKASQRK